MKKRKWNKNKKIELFFHFHFISFYYFIYMAKKVEKNQINLKKQKQKLDDLEIKTINPLFKKKKSLANITQVIKHSKNTVHRYVKLLGLKRMFRKLSNNLKKKEQDQNY